MATLNQANAARAQHATELAKMGAHAVGVEEGHAYGQVGWVVVAYVEPNVVPKLPTAISTLHEGQDVEVPLVILKSEPFMPQ